MFWLVNILVFPKHNFHNSFIKFHHVISAHGQCWSTTWDSGAPIAAHSNAASRTMAFTFKCFQHYHIRKTKWYGYHIRKTKWYGYANHVGANLRHVLDKKADLSHCFMCAVEFKLIHQYRYIYLMKYMALYTVHPYIDFRCCQQCAWIVFVCQVLLCGIEIDVSGVTKSAIMLIRNISDCVYGLWQHDVLCIKGILQRNRNCKTCVVHIYISIYKHTNNH